MTPTNLLLTAACVIAIAAGQVLFKLGALASNAAGDGAGLIERYANPYLAAAIVVYAGATVLWVALLKSVPLNVAYPFIALAFVLVPVLGALFVGEALAWRHLVGGAVIALGIWIVQSG